MPKFLDIALRRGRFIRKELRGFGKYLKKTDLSILRVFLRSKLMFMEIKIGRILEVPLPTCPFLINVPFSGGAYFRTMPDFVRSFFESSWQKSGFPIFYYFHARDLGFEKKPRNMDFLPGLINYAGNSMAKKKFLRIAFKARCVGMHEVISRLINSLEK